MVKGATAVAITSPTNQLANVATAMGELLQDVPTIPGMHLWRSRLRALETVAVGAGEFLNVVFGVLPTISDMQSFLKAVHKIDKRYDQFLRDAGRNVRRQYHFPKEKTVTTETLSDIYSPVGTYTPTGGNIFLGQWGNCYPVYETIRTRTVERDTWFSGAFTYHLPDWYDSQSETDRRRLMAQLFGAKPDLVTLWNLAPWSWAIDWFSNAQNVIKNVQALITYGTVLRYGYVMETTTVTDTYTAGSRIYTPSKTAAENHVDPPYPSVHPLTIKTVVKKRVQANPFGFGLEWDGLSPIQLAIAAALGINRAVR